MRHVSTLLLSSLVAALSTNGLSAQNAKESQHAKAGVVPGQARVLVLGTYHFANPGLDVVKAEVSDVLSPNKQAEIRAVIDALVAFRPTKIAVEQLPNASAQLDSLYREYRAGRHELSRNETQQLGFRLAHSLGHAQLYYIDHRGEFPFGPLMEYAQRHDTAFVALVREEIDKMAAESARRQRDCSVGAILRLSNTPDKLALDHGMYMRFARVGARDTYVGADLLSKWYDRNIRIFTNLQSIARAADRILVIIGSGHAPILRELINYDPALQLVEPLDFLPVSPRCE